MAKALGGLEGSVLVVCWEKFGGICGSVETGILEWRWCWVLLWFQVDGG